jgi:hypothetical protein
MSRNPHSRLICAIFAVTPVFSQEALSLPSWLQSYPGATPTVHASDSVVQSSYASAVEPADIVEHYRKLFEAAGLPFHPNDDGMGTSIRGEARECDLLIKIRTRTEGTVVNVNCSAKTQGSALSSPTDITVIKGRPQSPSGPAPAQQPHMTADEMMEQHHRKAAEMGLHRQYHDAAAPPLVWPSWLTNVNGAPVRPGIGVDQAKNPLLKAQYVTNEPMTEIYKFYRDVLNSHEYPARSSMSTGHTQTGIQQNAIGYVDGFNYPDGAPGAYTVIHVSFDRSVLNGPITVTMRFTTHDFIAKRGY